MHAPGEFVDLDGLPVHYIEKGSGDPLILLHGFFFDINMWGKNIDELAERFRVYAFDLWGFGYSSRKPMDYGYQLYSNQLLKFMAALDIPRASLMGQSMGGGTIVEFATSNQKRVEKIVLVDPAGMPNRLPIMGRISNLPGVGELLYSLKGDFVRKMTLGNTFLHNARALTNEFYKNLTRFHKIKGTTEASLYITRKQFFDKQIETIKKFASVNVPTLAIWGREDRANPLSMGTDMVEIAPRVRLEIIDQAGHLPNIDQPERFNRLVLDFLSPS